MGMVDTYGEQPKAKSFEEMAEQEELNEVTEAAPESAAETATEENA